MRIHREGFTILLITTIVLLVLNIGLHYLGIPVWLEKSVQVISLVFFVIVLQFFRNPIRTLTTDTSAVVSPADGKVVVIEEVEETEYFKGKRLQVSVFMSPFNVHINRNPVGGTVTYAKYHPGKYLVAWHPKSSTENERTTFVIKTDNGKEILFRQIAGALAKRIKWYIQEGQKVNQSQEMGFIKFGSRVDLYLPTDAKINVKIGDTVQGGITSLAYLT
ncbi:MAG: phosphatidylserine decarboxylase family protein [Bacteroidia bacterium]|nr:phosphatidylserine decarboxylase family protein [Bacteroidota bacterium]MCZ2130187.1 phosphatidylserine decarboxylase family protein [Bacteroidia bacterium]